MANTFGLSFCPTVKPFITHFLIEILRSNQNERRYFEETDTLFIKLSDQQTSETKELNENVMLEIDDQGNVVGLTIEHARKDAKSLGFSFETVAA